MPTLIQNLKALPKSGRQMMFIMHVLTEQCLDLTLDFTVKP